MAVYCAPAFADECPKAVTQQDSDACSANIAAKDDAALNRVYREVAKSFQDDSKTNAGDPAIQATDSTELQDLKAAEKAWIVYRDAECSFEAESYDGGSIQPMIESDCEAALTVQQTERLKSQLAE
jgi:uncharacterized protein YecT (DUF1311 family)